MFNYLPDFREQSNSDNEDNQDGGITTQVVTYPTQSTYVRVHEETFDYLTDENYRLEANQLEYHIRFYERNNDGIKYRCLAGMLNGRVAQPL